MESLSEYGLWGLSLSAFLAATIPPLSSGLVLSALLIAGENPIAVLIIATIANVAGAVINYILVAGVRIPFCIAGFISLKRKQIKLNNNLIAMEHGAY